MEKNPSLYHKLLWSTKRALIGEIVPCFRGIAVEWKKDVILLHFYIDGPISDELYCDCTSIGAEVIANFSEGGINEYVEQFDFPKPLPEHLCWVYKRKELTNRKECISGCKLDTDIYDDIYFKALKATLGLITPSIRGIYLNDENNIQEFYCYVDGVITNELNEDFEKIVCNFKKHSQKQKVIQRVIRMDFPQMLPENKDPYAWIYKRKEV